MIDILLTPTQREELIRDSVNRCALEIARTDDDHLRAFAYNFVYNTSYAQVGFLIAHLHEAVEARCEAVSDDKAVTE